MILVTDFFDIPINFVPICKSILIPKMKSGKKKAVWLISILALSLLVVAYTKPYDQKLNVPVNENSEGTINNVSVAQFKELISKKDGIILDVRTKGETDRGHIKDASFVDYYSPDFESKINLMQKNSPIYIYCQSGARSYKAAQIMARNGFKSIYNLSGGFRMWQNEGMEVTTSVGVAEDLTPEMSLEDFEKMLESDKAILVEFQTKWCAPCRQMSPVISKLQKDFENKALIVQIDADKNRTLARHFKLNGVPEFIVFKNKKETWRHSGIIDDQALREELIKAEKI